MTAAISIYNLRANGVAYNGMPRIAPGTVKTKTQKTVVYDDSLQNVSKFGPFGVIATIGGTVQTPGAMLITNTATLVNGDHSVVADLTTVAKILNLPASGTLAQGYLIWVLLNTTSTATLTVTPNGADTVLGGATDVMAAVSGTIKRYKLVGTNWAAQ